MKKEKTIKRTYRIVGNFNQFITFLIWIMMSGICGIGITLFYVAILKNGVWLSIFAGNIFTFAMALIFTVLIKHEVTKEQFEDL